MITISLCLIVKDEESTIKRCLDSIKDIVDEIIIVDTGSTDNTKEIIKKYNAKIYDFQWIDDFSAARNYSFSKATQEYQMWMDADDYLTLENQCLLKDYKNSVSNKFDVIFLKYNVLTNEIHDSPSISLKRERIVKRQKNFKWHGYVHEVLYIDGNYDFPNISINHGKVKEVTNRNLKIYEKMIENSIEFSERDVLMYASELLNWNKFDDCIEILNKFIDGPVELISSKKEACSILSSCYKKLDNSEKEINYIMQSFLYGRPSANECCFLGDYFLNKGQLKDSIQWFKFAISYEQFESDVSITCYSYITWVPMLKICLCYAKLGEKEKAKSYCLKAKEYIPNNPIIEETLNLLK